MKVSIKLGLALAIVFQGLVLCGMLALAAKPFWTGQEVRIETVPVDPRSLFRGNYARMSYAIDRIDARLFPESDSLRNGEIVYVLGNIDDQGLFQLAGATLEQPTTGLFLRGRIQNRSYEDESDYFRVRYGIEAYFAPPEEAIRLERELANGAIAVLMVDSNGKARLKQIETDS